MQSTATRTKIFFKSKYFKYQNCLLEGWFQTYAEISFLFADASSADLILVLGWFHNSSLRTVPLFITLGEGNACGKGIASSVARQPHTPRSGGAPTIRRCPTIYIVLVSFSRHSTLDFYSSGFCPQSRTGRSSM